MAQAEDIRFVLTRAWERNRAWAETLQAQGRRVLELPLIKYEQLPGPFDIDPTRFDWILFTSPQGVSAFRTAGLQPGRARLATLGEGTAAALAAAGLKDELGLRTQDGEEFGRRFLDEVPRPGRVLLPGPERRLPEPRRTLATRGVDVVELALYRTHPVPVAELPADPFAEGDVVFFCSPSTVRAFTDAYATRPHCVAIGATTAEAARLVGFTPAVAAAPDLEAMVAAAHGGDLTPFRPEPESES